MPTLTTQRLTLRPPRPEDAAEIARGAGDIRVARMTASIPHPYPPGAANALLSAIAAGDWPEEVWAIEAGGAMVGLICYKPASAEIGYWIAPGAWGQGYASEAASALADHLIGARGLPGLNATAQADNPASMRVLERAGFVPTGPGEGYSRARGAAVALVCYRRAASAAAGGAR